MDGTVWESSIGTSNKPLACLLLHFKCSPDTTYIILGSASVIIILAFFGCFAAFKEVKCLLLTYFVFMLLLLVVVAVGGILAYIFREQVEQKIM